MGGEMRTERKEFQELLKRLKLYVEANSKENVNVLIDDIIYKLNSREVKDIIPK